MPFDYVEVRIDGTGGVHLPGSGDESALPELARKQVIVAYAGAAAQRMFHPDQPDSEITQCSNDDRAKVQKIVKDFPEIKLEQARAEADLVRELRAVIQEIANALLRSETSILTQEAAKEIYVAATHPKH